MLIKSLELKRFILSYVEAEMTQICIKIKKSFEILLKSLA
jgi:hypothetical protein